MPVLDAVLALLILINVVAAGIGASWDGDVFHIQAVSSWAPAGASGDAGAQAASALPRPSRQAWSACGNWQPG